MGMEEFHLPESNPRRLRTLDVVIKLGHCSTDELFMIREYLNLAQGHLDNDRAIVDAAIDDHFLPPTEELVLPDNVVQLNNLRCEEVVDDAA